jgi:hypothetical protein
MTIMLVISLILLLSACQSKDDRLVSHFDVDNKNPLSREDYSITKPKKLMHDVKLESVYGWLDKNSILYGARQKGEKQSELMVYHAKTGKQEVFYRPNGEIINVSISPSKKFILIHTSAGTHKAHLDFLNSNGQKQFAVSIESAEVDFSWNPFNDGRLFLTAFSADWSYRTYLIDIMDEKLESIDLPQPFAQWASKSKLLYLDWDDNERALTAPLSEYDLDNEKTRTHMLGVIAFQQVNDALMAIQVKGEKPDEANYTFFTNDKTHISSFSVPLLRNFSEWVIPKYDYSQKTHSFYTFVPEKTGDANQYDGKFNLIEFNWETGKTEYLFKGMENQPISCSPDGNLCLYGHQLERIINLKEKKIYQLFKPGKDE